MPLLTFLRNSVISIPVLSFLIGVSLNNYYLLLLPVGLVISGIINLVLKQLLVLFPQKIFVRPDGARGCGAGCGNNLAEGQQGFPSGHAQTAWFFAIFMIMYNITFVNNNYLVILIYLIFAATISFSRLGYYPLLGTLCHTPLQVIVGSNLGIILGLVYFNILYYYFTN